MKGLLFTYLLTFGGGLSAQFRPFTGLLVYIAFAILRPEVLWWFAVPRWPYSRFVAITLLLGWALHGFGSWRFGRAGGIVVALLGFWVWLVVSTCFHPMPEVGWHQVEEISKVFLPFLVGVTLIDSVAKVKQIAWVIVLCQGYLAYEFNLLYYTTLFIPDEWRYCGLDRNGIAITMCTSIGLAFFLGLHSEGWWAKAAAFGAAGLMAHVVLFSLSRGGMVALLITGVVSFLLIKKQFVHYLALLLAVAVVLRLAGPQVRERFGMTTALAEGKREGSAQGRVEHWNAMLKAIPEHFVVGVGTRNWYNVSWAYAGYQMEGHSTWLQVAVEVGIPGWTCLVTFYLLGLWRLWPLSRESHAVGDPWIHYLSRAVIASLVGFIVSAQFVTVDGIELPYYVMLVGAGLLKVLPAPEGSPMALLSLSTPLTRREGARVSGARVMHGAGGL